MSNTIIALNINYKSIKSIKSLNKHNTQHQIIIRLAKIKQYQLLENR